MKWPSVSSLDSALESSPSLHSPADPSHLSPPASSPRPSRGHRRSASCGSPLSGGTGEGASRGAGYGGGASGPGSSDCRIIRVQMELGEDGSIYKSILVRAWGWAGWEGPCHVRHLSPWAWAARTQLWLLWDSSDQVFDVDGNSALAGHSLSSGGCTTPSEPTVFLHACCTGHHVGQFTGHWQPPFWVSYSF